MSNLGHYSPFNRSYQFIHLQNSAYHFKNKRNVQPTVKTNLKRPNTSSHSRSKSKPSEIAHRYSVSQVSATQNLRPAPRNYFGELESARRVIHRDEIVVRAKSARISRENFKIVQRLIDAECMITDKTRAETFYNSQKKYRNLRRRYQQNGERIVTPIGNMKLLNPTLVSFRTSHNHNRSRADIDRNEDDSF